MIEKFNSYTVADFLDDPDFIAYIKNGSETDRWEAWLQTGPPAANAFSDASLYLRSVYTAERITVPAGLADQVFRDITTAIDRDDKQKSIVRTLKRFSIAAACAFLMIGTGWYYYTDRITVATGFAQQQQVTLPDNSTVMLNANSAITYYRAFRWHPRNLWLKGEALFTVRHNAADHLTVQAGQVSIEVLGTRFTVRERRNQVAIALLDGKISIRAAQQPEPLILRPGESVNYGDSLVRISPIKRLPNQPQAWVSHSILANGMTVKEIIDTYEDTYGYRIILGDPSQAVKKIDGTLSLENEEGVLYTLANILNANIHREGKVIYLRPK